MSSTQYAYTRHKQPAYKPKTQVLEGNFPVFENYRDLAVFKFNRFLCTLLGISILISMFTYSAVISKEDQLSKLHTKINDINYENVELQNKLDYIKSFYNIDNKVTQANFLKRADSVMEVTAKQPIISNNIALSGVKTKPVNGF